MELRYKIVGHDDGLSFEQEVTAHAEPLRMANLAMFLVTTISAIATGSTIAAFQVALDDFELRYDANEPQPLITPVTMVETIRDRVRRLASTESS